MKKTFLLVLIGLSFQGLDAQDDKPKNWTLNGYVKHLHSAFKIDGLDPYLLDNLLHNRMNFRWYPTDKITAVVEMRTRVFYGDLIKINRGFSEQIESANNGFFDASVHWVVQDDFLVNTTMDRLYLQWNEGNFEARLGRQRINWGISTIWNPNDLFNAFAFTDFDYEERPGSDAMLLRYYTGVASSIEVAMNAARSWSNRVLAALYKFNTGGYDFQLLLGTANRDRVFGGGWAGNIKTAGFKGEFTYFRPGDTDLEDVSFALTTAFDYSFSNGLYLSSGYLYNSNGRTSGSLAELFSFELSAKNLYPFKHALVVSGGYPISPLVNANLAVIYSPLSSHPLFLNPTITLSIAQNWDLDIVSQLAYNKTSGSFDNAVTAAFMRIKYSF